MNFYDSLLKFNRGVWRGQRRLCRVPKQNEVVKNTCTEKESRDQAFRTCAIRNRFPDMLNCEGSYNESGFGFLL